MTDYSNYSLDELHDVYNHVNREKYPDIFNRIKAEIHKRELKDISKISVADSLNNLNRISNIDSWFNELIENGIHLNDRLKVLISRIFPYLNFETKAIISATKNKLLINFFPIKKWPIYLFSTYFLFATIGLAYAIYNIGLPLIFLFLPLIFLLFGFIRIRSELKNYVKSIDIVFSENSKSPNILIQLTTFSKNNREKKIEIFEIRKFKMIKVDFLFFPGVKSELQIKLKRGGKINLGYFKSKDLAITMCKYFNDEILAKIN